MKRAIPLVLVQLALVGCSAPPAARPSAPVPTSTAPTSSPAQPTIVTRAQTSDEAFDYLWLQLGQMPFFRAHGYDVGLPAHPLFQRLATGGLAGADRDAAHRVFAAEVYDPHAFDAGLHVLEQVPNRIGPALETFAKWQAAWGFEIRARYELVLTLYGPGGSYDTDKGVITMRTTSDGGFRTEPLQNAVHEMTHMGIERPVVQRFGLSHEEKERLVDLLCLRAFHDLLPAYHAQPMGPPAMDAFIDDAALADLPHAIERYLAARGPAAPATSTDDRRPTGLQRSAVCAAADADARTDPFRRFGDAVPVWMGGVLYVLRGSPADIDAALAPFGLAFAVSVPCSDGRLVLWVPGARVPEPSDAGGPVDAAFDDHMVRVLERIAFSPSDGRRWLEARCSDAGVCCRGPGAPCP